MNSSSFSDEGQLSDDTIAMSKTGPDLKPKETESNGLPKIGNAFSLSAAMMSNVSNIVMTTQPLHKSTADTQLMERNCEPSNTDDMSNEAENETYEILDVVENGSDTDANGAIETEANCAVDRPQQITTNNDCGSSLRIKKVFQGVTEHLLGHITTKRKEKVRANKVLRGQPPKKMAKKSTSNVNKIIVVAKPAPKTDNQIHGTTYSRQRLTSHIGGSTKTVQSMQIIGGDKPDDDLIELIEIPEKMQMELDTALNSFNEDSVVDSERNNRAKDRSGPTIQYKDYRCNVCLEQSKSFSQLKKHLFIAHLLAYVCRDCHATFDWNIEYVNHVQRGDCKKKLNAHRKYITLIDPPLRESEILANVNEREQALFCGHCSLKFTDLLQYCAHAQYHAKIFICKICAKEEFRSETGMAKHLTEGSHRVGNAQRMRHVFDENALYMSSSTEYSIHTDYTVRRH